MSKVSITRSLLDDLAMSISAKSGESVPLTLTEMKDAVDGIQTGGSPTLQTKTKTYTPTESAQTESVTADSGYDGLDTVSISIGAIDSNYVGSGITQRSSSDLTASGATVTVPSGYYSAQASKAVASGTAGTPTATKGTVSNHQVSVTPSVTNTSGYITGSTKTGTAVSVSASELVSGTLSITSSGTKDVTNYASASVGAGTEGTPTATKGTVSNHSVSVTPSVTNSGGYITGGTKTGTAVTVTASELASGNKAITQNGTDIDVVGYSTVSVDVSSGGTAAISVVDTTDSAGGTIRTITALDISDTTATASDVASGKYFYTANGTKTAGTGSGGGGGGLVYETGTYTPSSDSTTPYIYFTDTHSTYPIYINITDVTETLASENSMLSWSFINWYDAFGSYFMGTASTNYYGRYLYQYKTSSGVTRGENESTTLTSNSGGLYYLLDNTMFAPYSFGSSRYWRSGRTYKWIAVWSA